jgi:hypothetical protein
MKKIRIWGYPGLCLCLVYSFMLFSCAVKHEGTLAEKPVAGDTVTCLYKLEIVIAPVKWLSNTCSYGDEFNFLPYDIVSRTSYCNSRIFLLSFRTNDFEQVQLLREQLLATGVVEQVKIMKVPN